MGGGPSISGGMSKADYDEMLTKQAEIAKEAEATRQANLMKYEDQRKANEAAQLQALKDTEKAAINANLSAESEVAKEIQSLQENKPALTAEELQKLQAGFGSLYSGMTTSLKTPT